MRVMAGLALSVVLAALTPAARAEDVFHTLQQNSWYMPTSDGTARIFVTSLGKGPTVVVLHGGFGADFEYLVKAVEPHADSHRFILYDQRGSLLSPYNGSIQALGVDDLVDDLELLRRQLGEERLTLLAHSMGTRLAMEYARRYPDHVAALILLGTFPPRMTDAAEYERYMQETSDRGDAMGARPEVSALIAQAWFPEMGGDPADVTAAQTAEQRRALETRVQERLEATPGSYARMTDQWRIRFAGVNMVRVEKWRAMEGGRVYYNGAAGERLGDSAPETWDLAKFLGGRPIPVSVIQGDQDYVDPGATAWLGLKPATATFARCVSVHVIARAGHSAWLDDPSGFEETMNEALARTHCATRAN